jgi:hypothetical protein
MTKRQKSCVVAIVFVGIVTLAYQAHYVAIAALAAAATATIWDRFKRRNQG